MAEELTYRRLCDLCREEKGTNNLIALPTDFEQSAATLIAKMKGDADASGNLDAAHEHLNAVRLYSSLMRMRRQKIVFRALQDGVRHETAGMTDGEHALFDRMSAIILEEEKRSASSINSKIPAVAARAAALVGAEIPKAATAEQAGTASPSGGEFKKLRILKEVPSYRSADGITLGPYRIGDEVPLPPQEAEWMVRGRLAEEIS